MCRVPIDSEVLALAAPTIVARRHAKVGLLLALAVLALAEPGCAPRGAQPVRVARDESVSGVIPDSFVNSVGMHMVLIRPGTFLMGSPTTQQGHKSERPQHEVTISRPFFMGSCEVTQEQYEQVMGVNPSHFKGPTHPVDSVSWYDAEDFCRRLSEQEGRCYRLPTEAEWEYACRAGSQETYFFGDTPAQLGEYAWYNALWGDLIVYMEAVWDSHPVGTKKPNKWGLYDMQGNVMEWCDDWYDHYASTNVVDPVVALAPRTSHPVRVLRGGTWGTTAEDCRSAERCSHLPHKRRDDTGFRVVSDTSKGTTTTRIGVASPDTDIR